MAKRFGKGLGFHDERSLPAKRPKLELPKPPSIPETLRKPPSISKILRTDEEDLWGEDFSEGELEQLDLVASQACSQEVNVSTVDTNHREPRHTIKYGSSFQPGPSTSSSALVNGHDKTNGNAFKRPEGSDEPPSKYRRIESDWRPPPASQKLGSSEVIGHIDDLPTIDQFKESLIAGTNLNSTFQSQVATRGDGMDPQLQTLTGELFYWKERSKKLELKAAEEKKEKEKLIQEQTVAFENKIKTMIKEREAIKTKFDLQTLQLGSLMEKCKLLETNSVKLVQPSTSAIHSPKNKIVRSASVGKAPKVESCVQVEMSSSSDCELKSLVHSYPLKDIPASTFEAPLPEKSVVDVKFVEKIGQKNMPILQEEETFRIFENPELVKPMVTTVDGRQLSTGFFWSDVTLMMRKTSIEINSKDSIPIINKIVATTRELTLNATLVLKKILTAMKNDDIRDMNDLYFSDFYDTQIDYTQSLHDSNVWYKEERGIEARRAFGTLSYIANASNYLSEYITGKLSLITDGDEEFERYSSQMKTYNVWEKRGREFEMLEIMLEFVRTVGAIRRSHQFAGLICAIAMTICNAHKRVGFTHRGLKYVGEIFREMVFARPLLQCFVPLIDMLISFCGSHVFNVKICPSSTEKSAIELWKGAQYFTPDACTLAVFMAQLMRFKLDEVTTIKLAFSMLKFVDKAFLLNNISWPDESNVHNCRTNLLTFTITILYNCSKINLEKVRSILTADECLSCTMWRKFDDNFWEDIKRMQFNALRRGIRFLSFLAKRDPDFIVRASDVDDLFQLFMQQVTIIEGFTLHENEREALALITSTIALDKVSSGETTLSTQKLFTTKSALKNPPETSTSTENFCKSFHRSRVKNIVEGYKTKLKLFPEKSSNL